MSESTSSVRVKCPKCGGINVKQVQDKGKVLSYIGQTPTYKKVWKCKDCGASWE
nr:hypothetical protein [Candidatus Freyarchaeota archaeon]